MQTTVTQDREHKEALNSESLNQPPAESVRAELERVLGSKTFSASPRLSRFLKFTVEQTIQGNRHNIKEYLLGVDVFDRGESYDPRTDPIVRVEAGRLRAKLQQYYESEGVGDQLVFELPKGTYVPSFRQRASVAAPLQNQATPSRQRPRLVNILLALLLGTVAGASFWVYQSRSGRSIVRDRTAGSALAPAGPSQTSSWGAASSIAVLPFEDLSPQHDQRYFCDGITEALINALTKVEGLRVAARTSAFSFRDKQFDMKNIGDKLHVGAVLEGSIRRDGKRLRVSAELVNIADGLNIWSETYDRNLEDLFSIQDEISWAIVNALESKFASAVVTRKVLAKAYTRNPEAYSLYLRGRYHLDDTNRAGIEKSMSYFGKAIALDPNYALAYAGMAEAYNALGNSNLAPPHEVMPKARAAAIKALALDDSLAEAHAALGLIESTYDWNWQGSEREFRQAIALNSGYVSAFQWYGLTCLASTGRMVEALAAIKHAQELDPLSLATSTNLASVLLRLGRYDLAIQIYKETVELEPKYFWAYRDLGVALAQKHRFSDSIQMLEEANLISNGNPGVMAALGYSYAVAGKTAKAKGVLWGLKKLSAKTYVPPYHVAAIYAGLGNKSQALDWLDRAYEDHSSWMNGIKVDPLFTSLHSEPRFIELLKKMNLQ
jgi:TolB-like protein/Tfp pilus assembly protein PilF